MIFLTTCLLIGAYGWTNQIGELVFIAALSALVYSLIRWF